MSVGEAPIPADRLTIVPANEASWDERIAMLQAQTACGDPNAAATSGLVAFFDDEPVGWVAVEPRTSYPKLRTSRVPWTGRDEDKDDHGVWAVTCFVVRKGEVHVGARQLFEDAGFEEVSRPTVRRVVMRIDLDRRRDVRRGT